MTARAIIAEVAARYNLPPEQIRGPWQYPDLMAARREIARKLRDDGWSYLKIGIALCRTHGTIYSMLNWEQGHQQSRRRKWGAVAPNMADYSPIRYEARKAAKR